MGIVLIPDVDAGIGHVLWLVSGEEGVPVSLLERHDDPDYLEGRIPYWEERIARLADRL